MLYSQLLNGNHCDKCNIDTRIDVPCDCLVPPITTTSNKKGPSVGNTSKKKTRKRKAQQRTADEKGNKKKASLSTNNIRSPVTRSSKPIPILVDDEDRTQTDNDDSEMDMTKEETNINAVEQPVVQDKEIDAATSDVDIGGNSGVDTLEQGVPAGAIQQDSSEQDASIDIAASANDKTEEPENVSLFLQFSGSNKNSSYR